MKSIILSIKPQYAKLIYSGQKLWEYRKTLPAFPVGTEIVIYETKPVGAVTGKFTVGEIVFDQVDRLIVNSLKWGGISDDALRKYFGDRDRGVALQVTHPVRFDRRYGLAEFGVMNPPQSWCYVPS